MRSQRGWTVGSKFPSIGASASTSLRTDKGRDPASLSRQISLSTLSVGFSLALHICRSERISVSQSCWLLPWIQVTQFAPRHLVRKIKRVILRCQIYQPGLLLASHSTHCLGSPKLPGANQFYLAAGYGLETKKWQHHSACLQRVTKLGPE